MVEAGRMTVDVSSSPQNPVQFIEMFLLNTLRVNVLQQEGHKETLDPFFDYAKKILEPVILEVDEIIHQALSCKVRKIAILWRVKPWLFRAFTG